MLLWFTFSRQRRTWSFHVVVLQRTKKKCTKNYERGRDALRLAKGCQFRILVSLRVFWGKRYHMKPIASHRSTNIENKLALRQPRANYLKESISDSRARQWNSLSSDLCAAISLHDFKLNIHHHSFE